MSREHEIGQALILAVKAHEGQYRKHTGLPYVLHCVDVMQLLFNWGVRDTSLLAAALLHDVLEDSNTVTTDDIFRVAGGQTQFIVEQLTFRYDDRLATTKAEQEREYLNSFQTKKTDCVLVKVADRICNTLDYLKVDRGKAVMYWKEAESLIDQVHNRSAEFRLGYGVEICANMQAACLSTLIALA